MAANELKIGDFRGYLQSFIKPSWLRLVVIVISLRILKNLKRLKSVQQRKKFKQKYKNMM